MTDGLEKVLFGDLKKAKTIFDLEDNLNRFFSFPCKVELDQEGNLVLHELRYLVDRIDSLKIEIYPREHQPPHFHIKNNNLSATFTIDSCELISGKIPSSLARKIKYWHSRSKPKLLEVWDEMRPK